MAYIPDQAIQDFAEVGKTAFLLFVYYCKHGSMSKNTVFVNLKIAAKYLGISYDNATRANKTLKAKGWIKVKRREIILLKGWFETVKNSSSIVSETDENSSFLNIQSELKTDENSSFLNENSESKTDENSSQKLTKTAVAIYRNKPPLLNQQKKKNNSDELFQKEKIPLGKTKTQEPKGTRIPKDLQLSDAHRADLFKINPHRNAEDLFKAFKDYWLQNTSKNAIKFDWMAAWRIWCRKDKEFNGLAAKNEKELTNANRTTRANSSNNSRVSGAGNDFGSSKNGATSKGNGIHPASMTADERRDYLNREFKGQIKRVI